MKIGRNRHFSNASPPSPLPEVTYSPDSQVRQPRQLAQEMWHDLLASRELAWRLLVRDISAQYRQSFLGVFWAFVPPLVAGSRAHVG